ncbi:MAG: hypothetical protein JKX76_01750 [Colwellia sp.]|nr:hypothetical protein [Colwellia sp.]
MPKAKIVYSKPQGRSQVSGPQRRGPPQNQMAISNNTMTPSSEFIVLDTSFMYEELYQEFIEYYGNPTLIKLSVNGASSLYYAKVRSLIKVGHRYIIAIVSNDPYEVGNQMALSDLEWVAFQARELEQEIRGCGMFAYEPKRDSKLVKCKITAVNRTPTATEYVPSDPKDIVSESKSVYGSKYQPSISAVDADDTCMLPLKVTLIIEDDDSTENNVYKWPTNGNVAAALESFQTVVTLD